MTRVAYVDEDRETVELATPDAERVLARDPGLRREYARWQATTGERGGRLIVLDAERVRRALSRDTGAERAP